jgi:demethylmenaquinone methyltransferase/2-methoxy-6-polyprenyl-1,4-benzoquinol methylase
MCEYNSVSYMDKLYLSDPLQDPLMRRIVRAIGFAEGTCGLDAGCGVGLQIPPLAEAIGAQGRVTGLDILPEFLEEAGKNITKWGLEERVSLVRGDIYDLPFKDQEFDWIWSASCACYAMGRPLQLLEGFRRILKPGGLLLIVIWSGQQLLPGYPRLEAVLNGTTPGIAPFTTKDRPEHHFLRLTGWMRKAGYVEATAQPFTEGILAPLEEPIRSALLTLIQMRWLEAEEELSRADLRLYQRITDPSSPEFILAQPDYYGFYTYTLFRAQIPK